MTADVSIRLSVKDGEIVRTALKNIGRDGEAAWGRIEASAVRASKATGAAGKAANDNVAHYRRFGSVAQQAGYQIGDFAVQVASGQNALVAMTQQASQLLGFFGPWGAVIGAAAAVAGALAVAFWDTDEAADEASDSIKAYEEAVIAAEAMVKRLNDETKTSAERLRDERNEILKTAKERILAAQQALDIEKQRFVERQRAMAVPGIGTSRDESLGAIGGQYDKERLQDYVNALASAQQELRKMEAQINAAIKANETYKASVNDKKTSDKAARDAERQAESVRRVVDSLNAKRSALLQTDRQQAISNALLRVSGDLTEEQAAQISAAAGALYDYQVRLNDLNDALEREDKLMKEGERIKLANRTAQEEYNDEIARLNELQAAGAIDQETYARAQAQATEDLGRSLEATKKRQEKLNTVSREFGSTIASSFERATFEGGKLRNMLDGLATDLLRIGYRNLITEPLGNAFTSALSGLDFGSFFGFANGGVMTASGAVPLRAYSSGGIASSPQLALYGEGRKPEAYVPLPDGRTIPVTLDMAGQSGGAVVVQLSVVNNGSSPLKPKLTQSGFRGEKLLLTLDDVAENIADGGVVSKAISNSFYVNSQTYNRG